VPESSIFVVKAAIGKIKRHKSPGTNQIPGEMIRVGANVIFLDP
jgi:hypothetical protein